MTSNEFFDIYDKYISDGYSDVEAYEMTESDHYDIYKKNRYKDYAIFRNLLWKYNFRRSLNPKTKKIQPIRKSRKIQMSVPDFVELFNEFFRNLGEARGSRLLAYEMAELKHVELYGTRRYQLYKSFLNALPYGQNEVSVKAKLKQEEEILSQQ